MEWKELLYKMFVAGIVGAAAALPYTLQPLNVIVSAVAFAFVRGALVSGAMYFEPQPKITMARSKIIERKTFASWIKKHC